MNTHGGSSSIWMKTGTAQFASLPGDTETDVCIIGAGIAGLTTAYLMSREGNAVTVIDAMEVGAGETGRTTAHFFPPDERYFNIERNFGADKARLVADSFRQATDMVESIVRSENMDCDFERLDGYLYSRTGDDDETIRKELAAAHKAGVTVEMVDCVAGLGFDTGTALRFPQQAQFHPLKYLNGLTQAILAKRGRIHARTRALGVSSENGWEVVDTDRGKIRAKAVVVATNTPFNDRVVMHTKQAGYRTYVLAVRVPKASVPRVLLWDTGDPYHYLRLETHEAQTGFDTLIVGGADHKVGQDTHPERRYDELEAWVRKRFPMAGSVEYKWSGEVMEPADGVAFLGRNPMDSGNVYVITGDSGNGMSHCTIGAMLVTDLMMGRDNPWARFYDPARKPVHALSEFVRDQANTLAQYGDWFTGGEVDLAREIPPGHGAILRDATRKLAVFRDDDGVLHVLSATCTHLGGIVAWNSLEKSWDCPCHASRFDINGEVLHGPAIAPLSVEYLSEDDAIPLIRKDDAAGKTDRLTR